MLRFLAPIALALPLFAAACSIGTIHQVDTSGDKGKLHFEIDPAGCVLFCGATLDKPVLAGATVDVFVRNADPSTRYTARANPSNLADVTLTKVTCSSDNTCSMSASLDTKGEGDVALEIADEQGRLIDKTTVHLRGATSVSSIVTVGAAEIHPATDGAYEVKVGSQVKISSQVSGADGQPLLYSTGAFLFTYADKHVVGPDASVLLGSSGTEDAKALAVGATRVTVATKRGATHEINVRVVP